MQVGNVKVLVRRIEIVSVAGGSEFPARRGLVSGGGLTDVGELLDCGVANGAR